MLTHFERMSLSKTIAAWRPDAILHDAQKLHGGSSAQTVAVKLREADGRMMRCVVRRLYPHTLRDNRHAAAEQFRTLQLVRRCGVNAPTPHWHNDHSLILSYVEGEPIYGPLDTPLNKMRQIAGQLAAIHQIASNRPELATLPKQSVQIANQFVINPRPTLPNPDEQMMCRGALYQALQLPQRNASSLLHGDFWPGNLLWRDGQLVSVIDWEDAKVGDPLADFAISRFDVCFIFGRNALHHFTQTYLAQNPLDLTHLAAWDQYAALRIVSTMHNWVDDWAILGRPDITEATIRAAHRWFTTPDAAP